MSLSTDIIATVFTVTGVNVVVTAFQQMENAQRKLDEAQNKAASAPAGAKGDAARAALAEREIALEQLAERQAARMAGVALMAFRQIVNAAEEAIEKYTEFGVHAMAIRDLMGTTGGEAARITTLFAAFGMNHLASIREINRMSRDTMTPQGQQALTKLGIDPKGTNSGQELFFEIADAFNKMAPGIEKASEMQQIFGVRGVHNMLPILRLTHEQREAMMDLTSVTEEHLEAIQQWQFQSAMLGATWEQKVIFPILQLLLPALTWVVFAITDVVDAFGKFNQATHGVAGLVAMLSAAAVGVLLLVGTLGALSSILVVQNGLLAIRAALSGPVGWAALAVAGITIAGGALIGGNMDPVKHSRDSHTRAMQEHTAALRQHASDWSDLLHSGIPGGLEGYDVQQLARQTALGAIG